MPSRCHKCPLGGSNPIDWTLFLHFNECGNTSYFLSFLLTSHKLIQLFIPIDCKRQIRNIVENDLLLATKVIIYVNKNFVNLAVKFRFPNAMELRPLKCCICPKLTPRAQEFQTWKCLYCPSRNRGSVLTEASDKKESGLESEFLH